MIFTLLLTAVTQAAQISVSSIAVTQSNLNVACTVQNIAYQKVVTLFYCDNAGKCSNSVACSWTRQINSGSEIWNCVSNNLPNGIRSFTVQYQVAGQTYFDKGPNGNGYQVIGTTTSVPTTTTSSPPTTTAVLTTTTTNGPVTSNPATTDVTITSNIQTTIKGTATTLPSTLPGCKNWNGFDDCVGDSNSYDASTESRRWQTPPRSSADHISTYQDYSVFTGYTDVVYSGDRKSATLTFKPTTKVPNVPVQCNFGGNGFTDNLSYTAQSSFSGALTISCRIRDTDSTITLDDFYFYWDKPAINLPNTKNGQKGAIVELFGWPYNDIAKECVFLGKAGYMGVRVSAPNEHLTSDRFLDRGTMNPWYWIYQPVSYRLGSRAGTLKELRNAVVTCAQNGVRIYADSVVNHMVGNSNDVQLHRNGDDKFCNNYGPFSSTMGSPFYTHGATYILNPFTNQRPALEFPAVPYGPSDFHCERSLNSWTSPFIMANGWLSSLADLNTGKDNVQERIATYWATLISVGFSGFRIDAAKHISPDDLSAIFGKLRTKLGGSLPDDFITYLEIILGGEKDLLACQYNSYNYYAYLTDKLKSIGGLSNTDVQKVKIWSSDYPKEFPACGNWNTPSERFVIQNDDHDQQNEGSTSRDMQDFGSVLIKERDIPKHRNFQKLLFTRTDGNWQIRLILSGWFIKPGGSIGMPDGQSDCANYAGNQQGCRSGLKKTEAFVADSCGYSMVQNGQWVEGAYTRVHRDMTIINAMRGWMGLPPTTQSNLGIPASCA
ncbi:glycoside hydrolase superfamily [Globomyces pollinis-pini]|nr:glycoside hydrolase superfamily [Globomyces pollinis-pini]